MAAKEAVFLAQDSISHAWYAGAPTREQQQTLRKLEQRLANARGQLEDFDNAATGYDRKLPADKAAADAPWAVRTMLTRQDPRGRTEAMTAALPGIEHLDTLVASDVANDVECWAYSIITRTEEALEALGRAGLANEDRAGELCEAEQAMRTVGDAVEHIRQRLAAMRAKL